MASGQQELTFCRSYKSAEYPLFKLKENLPRGNVGNGKNRVSSDAPRITGATETASTVVACRFVGRENDEGAGQ